MKSILIIEDDFPLAEGLCRALSMNDAEAENCRTLAEAKKLIEKKSYSLIILDVNLPDGNGFDFLNEIKSKYEMPVIMLTANDLEMDVVSGLEAGADDYITKPFSLAVLRARVNTQLRRSETGAKQAAKQVFKTDDFIFDFEHMEFFNKGETVELSKTEQKLLRILVENAGTTLRREELVDRIWTDGAEYVDENALSVTVKRLRDKLNAQEYIKTVYGIGYVWKNT